MSASSLVPAAQLAPEMLSGLLAAVARLELEFSQTAPLAGGNTRIGHWLIRRHVQNKVKREKKILSADTDIDIN